MAALFKALADPTRLAVFERLAQGEVPVKELTRGLGVSQPAVSQHLAALRAAGLVLERKDGRFVYYRTRKQGLEPLLEWLNHYQAFWPERIADLNRLLKRMEE